MEISRFFINGDIKGAIEYMRSHEEFKDILPAYVAIFEDCEYRKFEVPDLLNDILRLYQIYFRDTFYCGVAEAEAAEKLLTQLGAHLNMPGAEEGLLAERLKSVFEENGYHAVFGKTQGYYGPYIWRDTVPTVYRVELPGGTAEYTVNILRGFVFRSWMDYLTFGRYGTGGWASPDGTINCIEQAYDFESERFLVSLLKHEAQHTVDMKLFPGITPTELEYRAKLVELCYSGDLGLLQKFLSEADESKTEDSHAAASARIKLGLADTNRESLPCVQKRALELFDAPSIEEAALIASDLKSMNESRKQMTEDGVKLATQQVEQELSGDDILVVYLPDCHESLAGIIAGRIREKYHRPVFVLTSAEEGVKGSGRSIEAYSMYEEMNKVKELFARFGGHRQAAGLTLAAEDGFSSETVTKYYKNWSHLAQGIRSRFLQGSRSVFYPWQNSEKQENSVESGLRMSREILIRRYTLGMEKKWTGI